MLGYVGWDDKVGQLWPVSIGSILFPRTEVQGKSHSSLWSLSSHKYSIVLPSEQLPRAAFSFTAGQMNVQEGSVLDEYI